MSRKSSSLRDSFLAMAAVFLVEVHMFHEALQLKQDMLNVEATFIERTIPVAQTNVEPKLMAATGRSPDQQRVEAIKAEAKALDPLLHATENADDAFDQLMRQAPPPAGPTSDAPANDNIAPGTPPTPANDNNPTGPSSSSGAPAQASDGRASAPEAANDNVPEAANDNSSSESSADADTG